MCIAFQVCLWAFYPVSRTLPQVNHILEPLLKFIGLSQHCFIFYKTAKETLTDCHFEFDIYKESFL